MTMELEGRAGFFLGFWLDFALAFGELDVANLVWHELVWEVHIVINGHGAIISSMLLLEYINSNVLELFVVAAPHLGRIVLTCNLDSHELSVDLSGWVVHNHD